MVAFVNDNAKATELAGLKKDAAAAVDALVKGYECEAVNNAATTLKGKINDCQVGSTGATLITTYYTDGKLVADQTEVEAVIEAVLDQAKVLAGEAVADLVDGLNLDEPENEAVKEAKEALESKIEACDALTGEAEAETALSTYWVLSTGLVEDQTEVKALVDAIEALTPATPDAP